MVPFLPKQISDKGIYIYLGSLAAVTLIYFKHAMPWEFMLIGVMWVVGFFTLANKFTKEWQAIPEKRFITNLFVYSLVLRVAWLTFSYFFYTAKTGMPFEFLSRDAMMYYWVSLERRTMSFIDLWNISFVHTPSVSDSGYIFYLSLLAKITGESIYLPRLIHSILSSISVVQIYLLAKRNIGEEGARIAGIFACLFPNLIYHCGLHMKETVMIFIITLFLERTDYVLRNKKYMIPNIILITSLIISMFTFRTVLGGAAIFAVASALLFSKSKVVGKARRWLMIGYAALAITTLAGGIIMAEVEETWMNRSENLEHKRMVQTMRGNQWAQYATATVMAPMIFVLPFPTMVHIFEQENQMVFSGGNYVRNFLGCFVLIGLFSAIFITKRWREFALIGSFAVAYLGIIATSGFNNSERFLLPGLPCLLIIAAYGVTQLNAKNFRFVKIWYYVVPAMALGWAYFKLGTRGML